MKIKQSVCLLCVFAALFLTDCGGERKPSVAQGMPEPSAAAQTPEVSVPPSPPVRGADSFLDVERYNPDGDSGEEVLAECMVLAELCAGEMKNAQTGRSGYFPYEMVLARETIDVLEDLLADAGYAVVNTDDVYPSYLENPEGLERFAQLAGGGEPARQAVVYVTRYRSLNYSLFQYQNGVTWHICATVNWDDEGEFSISEPYMEEVRDWGMVDGEFFYYRIYPFDVHWDACAPVRLRPADERLYDMCAQCVQPVGYQCTNIFLVDWSRGSWGEASFNDVFEYLYFMKYGERVDAGSFEYSSQLQCCLVPADIFESTVQSFFEIPSQELRDRAMYIAESDAYPWQPVISSNIVYFPTLLPEVRECRENADGTVTLSVDVLCFEEKCFPLFTHELTIAPDGDGGFRYLSNELIYVSDHSLPDSVPRLERRR